MQATSPYRGPWAPSSPLATCSTVRSFLGQTIIAHTMWRHLRLLQAGLEYLKTSCSTTRALMKYSPTRLPDLLSKFETHTPAKLSKEELENLRLFTEHATCVFDFALFECFSCVLSEHLWQGTAPSLQHIEVHKIAAGAWMDIKTTASGPIKVDFVYSFTITQQNWPGVTEEQKGATNTWSRGLATARCLWYLQQLQKALSGLPHQG